ncbi:hypothetical protein ACIRRA_42840 [Nocardia sp. NPDC101769]|uniref:hypothetical protein n=1 Tax=Nocardia sp. NPDC101769 TaxID=3364333 RepID=UPI003800495D
MAQLVTLAEWAQRHGLTLTTVRTQWAYLEGFPPPVCHRDRPAGTGSGGRSREYDLPQLDDWLAHWQAEGRPNRHVMPENPEEYRTLGAIARLVGVNGKTVTQYRDLIDQRADYEDRGARRHYRTRDVVDFLNQRPGHGRASDPASDGRRGTTL